MQYPDVEVEVRKQTREAAQILSITVTLSVCTPFKLIKRVRKKMYIRYCFLSTPCSPSFDFSGLRWSGSFCFGRLCSQDLTSHLRDLFAYHPKSEINQIREAKSCLTPTAVYIASAGFSAMTQEPTAITRASYSSPSNVTADDKARLRVSLSTTLAGAEKEPEAGTEVS